MNVARGLALAFALFAAAFALHIVGGATDQGWLFATAVVLIFATAVLFPAIAFVLAGKPAGRATIVTVATGALIGVALTASALWAANGRAMAWWTLPAATAMVATVNAAAWAVANRRKRTLEAQHPVSTSAPAPR